MFFGEKAEAYFRLLQKRKEQLDAWLRQLPEGHMIYRKTGKYIYPAVRINGTYQSLLHSPEQVSRYKEKELILKWKEEVGTQLEQTAAYLRDYRPVSLEALGLYDLQRIQGKAWSLVEGQKNSFPLQNRELVFDSVHYRSKSEMLIALTLQNWNIEFKSEVQLDCNGRKRFPDFTMVRPRDRKILYLEHVGLTGDEGYVDDLYMKLQDYHNIGLYLWDNLILTFDRPDGSLDLDYVQRVLRIYLE